MKAKPTTEAHDSNHAKVSKPAKPRSKPADKRLKIMRSTVMAVSIRQRGWDYNTLHDLMQTWGFGSSLRKLSLCELGDLLRILRGQQDPAQTYHGIGTLDDQGRYMWSLMKDAGWDFYRLRLWMLKHCSASHWNALYDSEKRAIIAMLKKYARVAQDSNPADSPSTSPQ
ncbi:MAG: hypothetical protein Q8M98_09915 [Candidatus Cloacimonadaceae bacterium]|nr:hypothetical protein [Candidatus Cloacimonadaceae bacterium]